MLGRLSKNTFSLLAAGLIDKLAYIVVISLIARRVSPTDFGEYNLVITMLVLGGILANGGLEWVAVREIAKRQEKSDRIFGYAVVDSVGLSLGAWAFLVCLALLLKYPQMVVLLIVLSGGVIILTGLGQMAGAVVKANERMEILTVVGLIQSVFILGSTAAALWLGARVGALILVFALGEIFRAGLLAYITHRRFGLNPSFDFQGAKSIAQQASPFILLAILAILIRRTDILLLGWLRSMEDVAIYSVAARIADFLSMLSGSLMGALFPALSARVGRSENDVWRLYSQSIGPFAILGFGVASAIMVLARPIVHIVFGGPYLAGATVLVWLGWAFFFEVLSIPFGTVLYATGRRMHQFVIMLTLVFCSCILLNLWFIPVYGYMGAAISMFGASVLGFIGRIILAYLLFKKLPNLFSFVWRPGVSALGMVAVLSVVTGVHLFGSVLIGLVTYFLLLALLGEFQQSRYLPVFEKMREYRSRLFHQPLN